MQGKNLTEHCRIQDHEGEKILSQADFPVIIGGGPSARIRLPEGCGQEDVASIGIIEGRLYVQAGKTAVPITHNDRRLKGSAWLFPGDTLKVGSSEISITEDDHGILFRIVEGDEAFPPDAGTSGDSGPAIQIDPVPFHSVKKPARRSWVGWLLWSALVFVLIILSTAAWFVFTARQVTIKIDPQPDRVSLTGGIVAPMLGTYYLLRPGGYVLKASKECYRPLERQIEVKDDKSQTLNLSMEKLPGQINLHVHQQAKPSASIEGARVFIDGQEVGATPLFGVEEDPGQRQLEVTAQNYEPLQSVIEIEGCGVSQTLNLALVPLWANVRISSLPTGASVLVGGNPVGETPLEIELLPGTHELQIQAAGFKSWRTQLEVKGNEPVSLEDIRLLPADGVLVLRTNPPGANVTVDGKYVGDTPMEIPLKPDAAHTLLISKAGYEGISRKVEVSSGASKEVIVNLAPITGTVYLLVEPADAELLINGQSRGALKKELQLTAVEHLLQIRKEGYQPFSTRITPRPGFPQQLKVSLTKVEPENTTEPTVIRAPNGYMLNLVRPTSFTMGSSRREQGRRTNETIRKVILKRPFYMGVREITNREFREFLAQHNSGAFKQHSLNRDDLPVVQVSWEQAALFCNWLSQQESLPLSYIKQGGNMVPVEPLKTGYRLPTEAEWEYCARRNGEAVSQKYPWGDGFPPPSGSGNFADLSAKDLLPNYLDGYNDGYPVSAPPAQFAPDELGFYDLGGNVAEWCHDYYFIYPYSNQAVYEDPTGPKEGKHRVVRGSSWKHSSISALRSAYRDYSENERVDLGFRICRYLDQQPKGK
jgi:formylglycine-generating enzyme required for sulfatase activity